MSAHARQIAQEAEVDYVRALNAVLASPGDGDPDVHRWRGHAEAYRKVAERARKLAGDPVPEYRSKEWRARNGVYSDEQVAQWRAQAARENEQERARERTYARAWAAASALG